MRTITPASSDSLEFSHNLLFVGSVLLDVGRFQNQELDLLVTVTSGDYTDIYETWLERGFDPETTNGKEGSFGKINVQTIQGKPKSGEGNFRFCFVKEGTTDAVELEQFSWTLFDIDQRSETKKNGRADGVGNKEMFLFDTRQSEVYQVIEGTQVVISCEDGTETPCEPGVRTMFHSSEVGNPYDNPSDPNELTFQQMAKSVSFTFQDTSCWDITYNQYCPVDQPDYTGPETECRRYNGGMLLFSGAAAQIIEEGECLTTSPTTSPSDSPSTTPALSPTLSPSLSPTLSPTISPTISPTLSPSLSPTLSPTMSPTISPTLSPSLSPTLSPSISPTLSPTDDPTASPTLPPPSCPEDVQLIHMNGVTEVDLGQAVRIIDQSSDSVTIRLNQAWTSSASDTVSHIFYQWEESVWESDCEEVTDVPGGDYYSPPEDITLYCQDALSIARIEICVADTDGGIMDPVLDNATVPKCCHPDLEPDVPVVCYHVLVQCESQCSSVIQRRGLRGGTAAEPFL